MSTSQPDRTDSNSPYAESLSHSEAVSDDVQSDSAVDGLSTPDDPDASLPMAPAAIEDQLPANFGLESDNPKSKIGVPSGPPKWTESAFVFVITFAVLAILAPRVTTYLSPLTGDEPFYAMTAI